MQTFAKTVKLDLTNTGYLAEQCFQTAEVKPGDRHTFQFDFPIKPLGYVVGIQGFTFGYGKDNDSHNVHLVSMDIRSELAWDRRSVMVDALAQLGDDAGHLMTNQGRDNSCIQLAIIAVPENVSKENELDSAEVLQGFSLAFPSKEDHKIHRLEASIVNAYEVPVGASMFGEDSWKAEGQVYSGRLFGPADSAPAAAEQPVDGSSLTTYMLSGFRLETKGGKNIEIRKLGMYYDHSSRAYTGYINDKNENHIDTGKSFALGVVLD